MKSTCSTRFVSRSPVLLFFGFILALALGSVFQSTVRADTVTNCTQQDLERAMGDGFVTFQDDCDISITNSIVITSNITFDASGFTVSITAAGTNNFTLFLVQNGATLTMNGITLMGGHTTNSGGALYIESEAEADLTECILAGNTALGTNGFNGTNGTSSTGTGGNGTAGRNGSAVYGGAIYNAGTLNLDTCKFFTNSATGGNGGDGGAGGSGGYQGGNGASGGSGAAAFGGAIYDIGSLTVIDSTFDGNTVQGGNGGAGGTAGSGPFAGLQGAGGAGAAASGAGIYAASGDPDIQRCTFSNNSGKGGNSAAGGTPSKGNGSNGAKGGNSTGGGVSLVSSTSQFINCTFFNNTVTGGSGGNGGNGTYNAGNGGNGGDATGGGLYGDSGLSVTNCTFANGGAIGGTNGLAGTGAFAGSNGSRGASRGGNIARIAGTFTLANSIVATNSSGHNGYGTVVDGGYNISSDASISLVGSRGSKTKTNPYIGTLGDNGGPTLTIPLVKPANGATSPAIDAIPTDGSVDFPSTDQRGQPRPQGARADIGAYESGPPLISLTNQVASLGSDVTFTAYAGGDGPFTYQWQQFGTNIPGAISSTLTIIDITPTNNGPFRVIVSNILASATSSYVSNNFPPSIVFQPVSQTVVPGATAFFTVTNTGDSPLFYRWYFQGTNGGSTNLIRNITINNNALTNGDVLAVPNTAPASLGNYFVSVSNKFLSVTSSLVTLAFGAQPVIISPPASVTTNAGSSVTFNVTASGNPNPAYLWQFNGTNLGGANGTSFTLSNVQTNNSGDYAVVVSNAVGMVTSSPPAHLTVGSSTPEPATITVQPVSQIVVAGSNATFSVVAEGTPPLSYQWRFNGVNIPGATLSTYTRVHAQPGHAGYYDVFVSNGYGSDESDPNVTLRVLSAPVSANGLKFSSNAFSFTFVSQTGFTYVVQFKNALGNPTWTTLLTTNGTGSPITVKDSSANASSRFYRIQVQ